MTISEKLTYCTTKIEAYDNKNNVSVGTGFFMDFNYNEEKNTCQSVIITNKHVIKDAKRVVFSVCMGDDKNNPLDTKKFTITLDDFLIIDHPSDDVDLCAISLATMENIIQKNKIHLFRGRINTDLIINSKEIENCSAIEDIIMIGYPIGIEDKYNNKPIIRKGITSTHLKYDYNNKKEFLIDISCFPGSSGSPVFTCDETSYTKNNELIVKTKCRLLGILHGGVEYTKEGRIELKEIATNPTAKIDIPINLGSVIKAERIIEIEDIMKNMDSIKKQ